MRTPAGVRRPRAGIQGGEIPEPPPRTPPRGSSRRFRGGLPLSKRRGTAALGSLERGEGSEATGPETVTGKASGMRLRRAGWSRDGRTRDPRGSWGAQAGALGSPAIAPSPLKTLSLKGTLTDPLEP